MRALQVELRHDRVVGMVQGDQLVALIRERGPRLLEVARHLPLAVVPVPGRDYLVARVVESAHGRVEVVPVLGLHELANDGLAAGAEGWLRVGHGARVARMAPRHNRRPRGLRTVAGRVRNL